MRYDIYMYIYIYVVTRQRVKGSYGGVDKIHADFSMGRRAETGLGSDGSRNVWDMM